VPDYSDPAPVRRQIADDLRAQIRAGTYAPGGRLPSNIALAERYGVATETIRSALDELRADKTVETRSTRGTFVTSVPPASPRPDLSVVSERVAELAERVEEYADLRAEVGRLRADILYLYDRFAVPYDHGDGGAHDGTEQAGRRRARR
jgi:DNA-binding GntR family transcriptional regulator